MGGSKRSDNCWLYLCSRLAAAVGIVVFRVATAAAVVAPLQHLRLIATVAAAASGRLALCIQIHHLLALIYPDIFGHIVPVKHVLNIVICLVQCKRGTCKLE